MAANRLFGQTRREARCGAITQASQRTRGADVPHPEAGFSCAVASLRSLADVAHRHQKRASAAEQRFPMSHDAK